MFNQRSHEVESGLAGLAGKEGARGAVIVAEGRRAMGRKRVVGGRLLARLVGKC
jgi:hypothetical protein